MHDRKKYYPWVIMAVCCVFIGGTIGIGTNCGSVFMPAMAREFDVGLGAIASHSTIYCAFMALSSLWVAKVINRMDIRKLMTLSLSLAGLGFVTQALARNLAEYYLSGVVLGIGIGMGSFMTVTMILNHWFVKNRGMITGVTLSVSSIVGIVMNPLLNAIIENQGWRLAAVLKGGLLFLIIPLVWLFVRMRPEEKGCTAWGEEEIDKNAMYQQMAQKIRAMSQGKQVRLLPLLMLVSFSFLFTLCMNHSAHLQNIAGTAGFTSAAGAMMVSAYLAGEFFGKLIIGWLNDKWGINKALLLVVILGMAGVGGLFFLGRMGPGFGLACALLFGPMTANCSVGYTLIANNLFGPELYPQYYPYLSIASTVAFSVGAPIIGFLYDSTGAWELSYVLVMGGLVVAMILLHISSRMMEPDAKKA